MYNANTYSGAWVEKNWIRSIWKPLTQHCTTAESWRDYDECIRRLETVVQQQAITLHRFSLSLWWWTHLLRPSQEEIAPLKLCCLSHITQSSLSSQLSSPTLKCVRSRRILEQNSREGTLCDLQQAVSLALDTGTVNCFRGINETCYISCYN